MYFVVYLLNDRINIIVPKTWIRDSDEQMEKFVNRGLNSNQKILCFWSQNPFAFDSNGRPKMEFFPNSNKQATNFPEEGWHLCKLKRFHSGFFVFYLYFKRSFRY